MAVYTKINNKDLSYINNKFKSKKFLNFKGIKQGIENTNYLLRTQNEKFILTIFEKRVSQKEIPFFMSLMDQLNNSHINCPKPLRNNKGDYLIRLKNISIFILLSLFLASCASSPDTVGKQEDDPFEAINREIEDAKEMDGHPRERGA